MAAKTTKKRTSRKQKDVDPGLFIKVSDTLSQMKSHTTEAVFDAWDEMEVERRRELLAIPLMAVALISFLSLISYSPYDLAEYTAFGHPVERDIHNWIGQPGAWLAHGIITLFGASGFALPALFLFWGIDRFRTPDRRIRGLRIAGFVLLLFSISIFIGVFTEFTTPLDSPQRGETIWRSSGAVGFTISRRLLELGALGACIISISLIAVNLILSTPFLFSSFFSKVADFLFPPRDTEELDVDDYEDEESFTFDTYHEESEQEYQLSPLDEWEGATSSANPAIGGVFDDELEELPALGVDEEEYEERLIENNESRSDLKIITKEEEPLQEFDIGVNLIKTPTHDDYELPSINLLDKSDTHKPEIAREEIIYNSQTLERTLKEFNIPVKVVEVNYGPTITCYELEPAPGIKISRIENLSNDITRALKAECVRIVAPIPGKGTVGVEIPNRNRSDVLMRDIIASEAYQNDSSKLKVALGKTISGEPYIIDLTRAPHLLVAGATGSGKSVCINTIITSFLYNAAPHEVKLLMVDPKQVELALYRDIPHLLSPVITDPKKAGAALRWAVDEMETRYRYLKKAGVRNIKEYNKKRMAQQEGKIAETESSKVLPGFLPYIVIIIDELADLMMIARVEVESLIARLAAMARAVGIHLVLATQRPSVDVLTGVIKNNFPARIAFQVSATADSRTILDMKGAESLLGRGDMLFSTGGAGKPIRLQCAYVSTEEVESVAEFVKSQQEVEYVQEEFIPLDDGSSSFGDGMGDSDGDELYEQALQVVLENDSASTSLLQRRLKIGYGRAARLLDLMEERGIVGPSRGSKPREVIMNNL